MQRHELAAVVAMNAEAGHNWVVVDIGNTSMKFGLASPPSNTSAAVRSLGSTLRLETLHGSFAELPSLLSPVSHHWFIASVNRTGSARLQEWLTQHRPHDAVQWVKRAQIPVTCDMEFPDRVGLDRLLAAHAVNFLRQAQRGAVIVNSGTAITIDLVTADGVFRGGAIFPGLELMARALHEHTDALPLVALNHNGAPALPGKNTEAALRGALYWGVRGALTAIVEQLQQQASGTAEVFLSNLDPVYFAGLARVERFLVLRGLLATARELERE